MDDRLRALAQTLWLPWWVVVMTYHAYRRWTPEELAKAEDEWRKVISDWVGLD